MADSKISELPRLDEEISSGDFFVVVDVSETDITKKTKRVTLQEVMGSPGSIGNITPSFAKFLIIELSSGPAIHKITTDEDLSENSDSSIPTEKAVRSYVNKFFSSSDFNVKLVNNENVVVENGDVVLVNTTDSNVDILLTPSLNGKIVVKKISPDLNKVIISVIGSGKIDNEDTKILKYVNSSYFFVSDEFNFYII